MLKLSKIVSNIIPTIRSRQEKLSSERTISYQKKKLLFIKKAISSEDILFPTPVDNFTVDPEKFLTEKMTPQHIEVLNLLIWQFFRFRVVAPSQAYLAKKIGRSRRVVNEILRDLHEWKLIFKGYRHRRTCFYNISEYFASPHVRSKLGHVLKALRTVVFFTLSQLLSQPPMKATHGPITPANLRIIRKKIVYNKYRPIGGAMEPLSQKIYGDNPISMAVRSVTIKLNLTRWGQIRLSAFPDHVIEYAAEKLQYSWKRTIDNRFNWFFTVCLEYCQENDITPEWTLMYRLMEAYKMPSEAPMTRDQVAKEESIKRENQSSSPKKKPMYEPYKLKPVMQEDPIQAKKVFSEWLSSDAAEKFAKLLGKDAFTVFVASRLAAIQEEESV